MASDERAGPLHLAYRTNGPEFDFPLFTGSPSMRYVICSTARSGSNLLQRALWRTNLAGAPEEYLTEHYAADFAQRWPAIRNGDGYDLDRYVTELMRHRTSPNGAFGIKVHDAHLSEPMLRDADIDALLSSPRYVWIRRRDRVRQAVSWSIAVQTGVWIADGEWLEKTKPTAEPAYDFDELADRLEALEQRDRTWAERFERSDARPHIVYYEDLASRYEETIRACLSALGIEPPDAIPDPGIARQADERNEAWSTRFRTKLEASGRELVTDLPSLDQ